MKKSFLFITLLFLICGCSFNTTKPLKEDAFYQEIKTLTKLDEVRNYFENMDQYKIDPTSTHNYADAYFIPSNKKPITLYENKNGDTTTELLYIYDNIYQESENKYARYINTAYYDGEKLPAFEIDWDKTFLEYLEEYSSSIFTIYWGISAYKPGYEYTMIQFILKTDDGYVNMLYGFEEGNLIKVFENASNESGLSLMDDNNFSITHLREDYR